MKNKRIKKGVTLATVMLACLVVIFVWSKTSEHGEENRTTEAVTYSELETYAQSDSTEAEDTEAQTDSDAADTTAEENSVADAEVSADDGSFEVTMLDVGQGLSILVEADGEYLLYDGGGSAYSSYVVAYLEEQGIDEIDYLVASHYDEDHIAGLVGVLNALDVETIIQGGYENDTQIYYSFTSAVESSGADVIEPEQGYSFYMGDAEVTVVGPVSYDYDSSNDMSIVLRIEYDEFSVIMTGDAEEESETDIITSGITLDSDLYIVGHHGSSSSSSDAFLSAVSPTYAFISCGAGNSYGHPHQETMDALLSMGVTMFRSDLQGEVTAYSDGTNVWFSAEACTTWTSGNNTTADTTSDDSTESADDDDGEYTYVLNTSSLKFHTADCEALEKMSDTNKEYTTESRETLIQEGYTACGMCNP